MARFAGSVHGVVVQITMRCVFQHRAADCSSVKLHIDRRRRSCPCIRPRPPPARSARRSSTSTGRLHAIDQASSATNFAKGAHDVRLIRRIEREIRVLPIAEDAEALEAACAGCRCSCAQMPPTACAPLHGRRSCALLHHLELNGQPVAVPARNEGRMKARHGLRLHDQILEHLVQRRAHVDVAIREGRAVMQDELGRPLALGHDAAVELRRFPLLPSAAVRASRGPPSSGSRSSAAGRCLRSSMALMGSESGREREPSEFRRRSKGALILGRGPTLVAIALGTPASS